MKYNELFSSQKFEDTVNLVLKAAEETKSVVIAGKGKSITLMPNAQLWVDLMEIPDDLSEYSLYKNRYANYDSLPLLGAVATAFSLFPGAEFDSLTIELYDYDHDLTEMYYQSRADAGSPVIQHPRQGFETEQN